MLLSNCKNAVKSWPSDVSRNETENKMSRGDSGEYLRTTCNIIVSSAFIAKTVNDVFSQARSDVLISTSWFNSF